MSFRGPCPRCGDLLTEYTRRCGNCGALTSLSPLPRTVPRVRRAEPVESRPPDPPPVTSTRYVVRECEGYRINFPVRRLAFGALPNIECVVLDTAWNHRQVASFASENYSNGRTRATGFALCRAAAATRCDLLNRLDGIAREAQGAVA